MPEARVYAQLQVLTDTIRTAQTKHTTGTQRIISLSPSTTELVYSLGAQDRLLGVSKFSNYPPDALNKPLVGDAFALNTEQLIRLDPDIILSWSADPYKEQLKQVPKAKVWQSQPASIKDLLSDINTLAELLNSPHQALVQKLEAQTSHLAQRYSSQKQKEAIPPSSHRLRGLLLLSQQPVYILANHTIQNDALKLCGADNVFADIQQAAAIVNIETIMLRQPDFVVYTFSDAAERQSKEAFIRNKLNLNLNDVQMIAVDSDTWSRPTVRFLNFLPVLCERIDALRQSHH